MLPLQTTKPAQPFNHHPNIRNAPHGPFTTPTGRSFLAAQSLNNAFRYCKRGEVVAVNPLADRPRYQPSTKVRHCREFMPDDADELHRIAALLFDNPHSHVLGFQMLFEAYTGLRTSEVLKWGADKFGTTTADGRFVHVWRCKGQHAVNPYVTNHEGLQGLLAAHVKWKTEYYPDSPWFFPGHDREANQPVHKSALAHTLRRLHTKKRIAKKRTSHGMRAFYVTVRRDVTLYYVDRMIPVSLTVPDGGLRGLSSRPGSWVLHVSDSETMGVTRSA